MAWVDFFVHTVLGNILWVLLVLGVGAVTVYFKGRGASWVKPLLYGLAASGLMIGITAGLACISYFSYASQRVKPPVTPNNVETRIRDWAYAFNMNVQKLSRDEAPDAYFAIKIAPETEDMVVFVMRLRSFPHYIIMQATLELGTQHKATWAKLSPAQKMQLLEQLRIEMNRCRVVNDIPIDLAKNKITLERRLPITDELTEDAFVKQIEGFRSDLYLARDTIVLGMEKFSGAASTHEGH